MIQTLQHAFFHVLAATVLLLFFAIAAKDVWLLCLHELTAKFQFNL